MILEPRNRHILVVPNEEEPPPEEAGRVLLPETYRPEQSPYLATTVLCVAPDVSQRVMGGDTIIVERSMLNEVTFEGETFYLVLENYILGVIEREI